MMYNKENKEEEKIRRYGDYKFLIKKIIQIQEFYFTGITLPSEISDLELMLIVNI